MIKKLKQKLKRILLKDNSSIAQKNFILSIMQHYKLDCPKLRFEDIGFKQYSQHNEDGILLYIFALIGQTNKVCVEICCGDGQENNTANLLINHGWSGLLIDGNKKNITSATTFFNTNNKTMFWPPKCICKWITKENINKIISDHEIQGNIDLLSIDIDGNDYWIWKEINIIRPRVIVIEFNHILGPKKSVSIPYEPQFIAEETKYGTDYAGASLAAMNKLGKEKGYKLIGVNSICTNAFFIDEKISHPWLDEVKNLESLFSHPRATFGMSRRFKNIRNKKWEDV